MSEYNFEDIGVVILEGQDNIRAMLRETLTGLGFRKISEYSEIVPVWDLVGDGNTDLLIVDLDLDQKLVCSLIRDHRQNITGSNPFVVIIATTWIPEETAIRAALDAGADSIVTKPISVPLLTERVNNLVRERKEFVAAPDYVGPDRRAVEGADGAGDTIAVPNSLRDKATGEAPATGGDEAVKLANQAIGREKIRRLAREVDAAARRYEKGSAWAGTEQGTCDIGAELSELVSQITLGVEAGELRDVSSLASSMNEVMAAISRAPSPPLRQLEILRLHSQAIVAALGECRPGDSEAIASALVEARSATRTHAGSS